jgi:hypothetical protein
MRQCHWSRAKMYGRHSGALRIVFGIGHFSRSNPQGAICRFGRPFNSSWSSTSMAIGLTVPDKL